MVGHVLVINDKREDKDALLQQQLSGTKTQMLFTETALNEMNELHQRNSSENIRI